MYYNSRVQILSETLTELSGYFVLNTQMHLYRKNGFEYVEFFAILFLQDRMQCMEENVSNTSAGGIFSFAI